MNLSNEEKYQLLEEVMEQKYWGDRNRDAQKIAYMMMKQGLMSASDYINYSIKLNLPIF